MIHAKVLQLGAGALLQTTQGQVINLVSNDVQRFIELGVMGHFTWVSMFDVVAILLLVALQVSTSCSTVIYTVVSAVAVTVCAQLCTSLFAASVSSTEAVCQSVKNNDLSYNKLAAALNTMANSSTHAVHDSCANVCIVCHFTVAH
jgi:uncharacterized membrane protein YuzA (DUF378 family)